MQQMEEEADFTKTMEALKTKAFVGYGLMELFGPSVMDFPQVELQFGKYNDRAVDVAKVKELVDSFIENGVQQSLAKNAIPVEVDLKWIQNDVLVRSLEPDGDKSFKIPKVTFERTAPRTIPALGGQHRFQAALALFKTFEGRGKEISNELMRLKDYLGSTPGLEERMPEEEMKKLKNEVKTWERSLQVMDRRRDNMRYWLVEFYDQCKSLL